ncbi:hypothetical protein SOPP22_16050 [Shewanella sp. OPT22]|nr:hypothetical protein SOPP22_16050 [Shewanella sp. OPT22]
MNRYNATTSSLLVNGQYVCKKDAGNDSIYTNNMNMLIEQVEHLESFAPFTSMPLINAYFVSGLNELKEEHDGGFAKKAGVKGFKVITEFMEKVNPILKQVLEFDLVDVPLRS